MHPCRMRRGGPARQKALVSHLAQSVVFVLALLVPLWLLLEVPGMLPIMVTLVLLALLFSPPWHERTGLDDHDAAGGLHHEPGHGWLAREVTAISLALQRHVERHRRIYTVAGILLALVIASRLAGPVADQLE